jgi:Porin PorA
MRRLWGSTLLGLGVFLVVVAGMLRFYVFDQLLITPKDQYAQTIAPGTGTYFDPGTLQEKTSDLVARRTLKGDVAASNGKTGVWDVSLVIETGDGTFVRAVLDRVAFDRRSAQSVHCCGEAVDSERIQHDGVTYKFPFNTGKGTYQFWDVNSSAAYPAVFRSEEKVQGLNTYKFIQEIPGHQLRTQEVPGSLVGESSATFKAPVFYQNVRTVWVEPTTGIIIKGTEQTKTTLRDSSGQDKVVVLEATFTFDEPTQKAQADLANDSLTMIRLVKWFIPGGALLVGLVLIALGALMIRRSDRAEEPPAAPVEAPVKEPVG